MVTYHSVYEDVLLNQLTLYFVRSHLLEVKSKIK
jgi:hypothetical protein